MHVSSEPSGTRPGLDLPRIAPPAIERRGEIRSKLLLMRAAKLVYRTSEYVCLLRDISPGGVKIRMFHDVPHEARAALKLAHNEPQPMVRVWKHDTSAGFRFLRPISPEALLLTAGKPEDREIHITLSVPGTISVNGSAQAVRLYSLSQNGAYIESDAHLALSQRLTLSVNGLGQCGGWVRRRRGRLYEITFETKYRLDQLAARALALQPLPPHEAKGDNRLEHFRV